MGEKRTKDCEEVYINIFGHYQEVVSTRESVTKWMCSELYDLMQIARDPNNGLLVTHAIQFLLSLRINHDLPGISVKNLNLKKSKNKQNQYYLKRLFQTKKKSKEK